MGAQLPLAVAASHPAQNSAHPRGHVVVLPGRGENAELYRRLGERLAYDGYTVSVLALPELDRIDTAWLDAAQPAAALPDAGPVTLVGSDSGAALAAHLAERAGAVAVVLAGIGGHERADDGPDDAGRVSARSSCQVYRGRLAESGADLSAPAAQSFAADVAARLDATELTVPTLVVHGEDDPISPLGAALERYRALAPGAALVTVAGGLHDILNDVTHRSVSAEIVQFLERRTRPVLRRAALAETAPLAAAGALA